MSARLSQSLISGKVTVRKRFAGEIMVTSKNGAFKSFAINHSNPVELTRRSDMPVRSLLNSNLADLARSGAIEIL